MEDALGDESKGYFALIVEHVLILVLMEDALGDIYERMDFNCPIMS